MLEVIGVEALLPGRRLRLTLSNGLVVVRDVSDLLWGPVFERIALDDATFSQVIAAEGTAAWPADGADIAPEALIWNGPEPPEGSDQSPPLSLTVVSPGRPPG